MNKIVQFFILLLGVIIIYFRPLYLLIFLILFCFEYFYFVQYLFFVYLYMDNSYHKLTINRLDVAKCRSFVIWININHLNAYRRIYLLLHAKKFDIKNILIILMILFFNIPFKFIYLLIDLIKSKHKFRDWLEIKYTTLYHQTKDLKIEILNKNIYLNCFTLRKFVGSILHIKPDLTRQECFNYLHDTKIALQRFSKYEKNNDKVKMTLAQIKLDKDVTQHHYTFIEKKTTIHQTSNVSFKLTENQRLGVSLPDLTKHNSKNPGTIITKNIDYLNNEKSYVWVPEYQISSIKFDHLDIFNLPKEKHDLIVSKNEILTEIFRTNLSVNLNNQEEILKNLRIGNYTFVIENTSNKEMISIIKDIIDEIN